MKKGERTATLASGPFRCEYFDPRRSLPGRADGPFRQIYDTCIGCTQLRPGPGPSLSLRMVPWMAAKRPRSLLSRRTEDCIVASAVRTRVPH